MLVRLLVRPLGCVAIAAAVISCGGGGADAGSGGTPGPTTPTTPTVATVTVTPATNTLIIGATAQLAAAATTSAGTAVSGLTTTWSSSAQGVATVSGTGLVTAVAAGTATISATMGGVSGTAALVVQAAAFTPQAATTLSGTQAFQTVTIPAGVTVTATSNLDLTVAGAATIAGTLTGDCVRVRMIGSGSLTITGTVRNTCATQIADPPEMKLVASSISVTNARLEPAGALTVTNDSTITEASIGGGAGGAFRLSTESSASAVGLANQTVQSCRFEGTTLTLRDGAAGTAGTSLGGPGRNGQNVTVSCRGNLVMTGTTISSGKGGNGGDARAETPAPVAVGGEGGRGGRIVVLSTGDIEFGAGVQMTAGSAGFGGAAVARATISGGSATATGGRGGVGSPANGSPIVIKAGGMISLSSSFQLNLPYGGGGGNATATAGTGIDAAGGQPAGSGGVAAATGGAGGDLAGTLVLTGGRGRSGSSGTVGVARGGEGGSATAVAGVGGRGDVLRPTGGAGGNAIAVGGAGGNAPITDWLAAPVGEGSNGGTARVLDGHGGLGFADCESGGAVRSGGTGGVGGSATGRGGAAGVGASAPAVAGMIRLETFGHGGGGGSGIGPGAGGPGGTDGTAGTKVVEESFSAGTDGAVCPVSRLTTTWTVPAGGDPNDHFLFVLFQGLATLNFNRTGSASLVASLPGNRASVLGPTPITVTGVSPWVTLTGTISPTGAVTATGTGTVAGYAGTQVRMSGTITNGVFTGTVVAGDQTPQTLPGGGITYSLTGPVRVP